MAKNLPASKIPFAGEYEKNIFIFAILSQKAGPEKHIIHTDEAMSHVKFNQICSTIVSQYEKDKMSTDLIAFMCEKTGWTHDEYYNKYDYVYSPKQNA